MKGATGLLALWSSRIVRMRDAAIADAMVGFYR